MLFPLLKQWVETSPYKSFLISFIISYGIQKLFYFIQFDLNLIPRFLRPYLWILFPTWLFYFVMGLLITYTRLIYIKKIASQNSVAIILITIAFACIYIIESNATKSLESIKSPLNIYVPLVFLFSFSVWNYIGKLQVVRSLTHFLAKHSMTIYFEHVLVLYFFRHFSLFSKGMSGMTLLLLAVTITSCLFAVLLDRFTHMVRAQTQ